MNKEGQLIIEYVVVICVLLVICVGGLKILVSEFLQSVDTFHLENGQLRRGNIVKKVELCHYLYNNFQGCDMDQMFRTEDQ